MLGSLLLTATWLGLLAGFAELVVVGIRGWLPWHAPQPYGLWVLTPHRIWVTPLCDMVLAGAVGAALAPLTWLLPRPARLPVMAAAMAFLTSYAMEAAVVQFTAAPDAVGVVLAAACALVATRKSRLVLEAARRTTPWMLAAVGVAAVSVNLWQMTDQRPQRAALTALSSPNVLLVVLDTVRADHLDLYGYHRPTAPNLRALAAGGVTFEQAIAPSSWTLPSHASMFTGRYPFEMNADIGVPLDRTFPTLAEWLRDRGYHTAAFVGNLFHCHRAFGLSRGFSRYQDVTLNASVICRLSSLFLLLKDCPLTQNAICNLGLSRPTKSADEVNNEFLRWLPTLPSRPFFAFINYADAHQPYLPLGGPLPLRYDAAVERVDQALGRLLNALREQGLLQDTLVIVTADHGQELGEHGLYGHAESLYIQELHVPLVLSFGNRLPPARVKGAVSLRDVAATVTDLLGMNAASFGGASLLRYVHGAPPQPVFALFDRSPISGQYLDRSIIYRGWQLIEHTHKARDELFDLRADPTEAHNLLEEVAVQSDLEMLRARLHEAIPTDEL